MDTHVAIQRKGDMDEDLFIQLVLFYKSLYLNLAHQIKWGAGGKLIEGPILLKLDSGPGRNCKSKKSIKFCHDMYQEGIHLGPGLPNMTSCTQKMDDFLKFYKGKTNTKKTEIFE